MLTKALTVKALATLGVLALGSVGAGAATGSPPPAAHDGPANASSHVGVPRPASHDSHPSKHNHPGKSDATPATPTTGANHGSVVSSTAHTTDATGRDKGAAISAVARGNHGGPPTSVAKPKKETPTHGPRVPTPNAGGIGTGSTASRGANATGVEHAAPQAAAGSANAGEHPTGH